jgi:hypothetical protein
MQLCVTVIVCTYIFSKPQQGGNNITYNLEVILNEGNNHQINVQERIKNDNKIYFMLQIFFKNKNISKKLKLILGRFHPLYGPRRPLGRVEV